MVWRLLETRKIRICFLDKFNPSGATLTSASFPRFFWRQVNTFAIGEFKTEPDRKRERERGDAIREPGESTIGEHGPRRRY